MDNIEDYRYFEDFFYADLQFEVTRYIKRRIILELTQNDEEFKEMERWIQTNVLVKDELDVYNKMLNTLGFD